MANFEELNEEVIDYIKKVMLNFNLPVTLKYYYQDSIKQKKLMKISKIPEQYAIALGSDVMIHVNQSYFDNLDDEIKTILIEQELDKIEFNLEKGTFKIFANGNLTTSTGLIDKYTYPQVYRANQTEKEFTFQQADKDE